jgi:hypothetical protein
MRLSGIVASSGLLAVAVGLLSAPAAIPASKANLTSGLAKGRARGPSPKWSAHIGLTGFRTTIQVSNHSVFAPSNGREWHPSMGAPAQPDPDDGIWVLDAATGRVTRHIVPPGNGEKDVNGVAIDGSRLVWGTDQGILYQSDRSGRIAWKVDLGGDVEGAPAMADFTRDGVADVAVGAEDGDFFLIDGSDGTVLKRFPSEGTMYDQMRGFLAAPALWDVSGDGVKDVFAPGRDGRMRSIDGASGLVRWTTEHDSALHGAPVITDTDGDGRPELVYTACYSTVTVADAASGEELWQQVLEHPGVGIEGLFSAVTWHPELACALVGTAWWGTQEGFYCVSRTGVKWRYTEPSGNITSGAVIGDTDGRPGNEVVFGTESGKVVAVDATGKAVWSWKAGGPVETTPTMLDLDDDGLNEILVASQDGLLTALDTAGKAPPLLSYHRGSATNDGALFFQR